MAPERTESEITLAAHSLWGSIHGIGTLFLIGNPLSTVPQQFNDSGVLLVRNFIRGWLDDPAIQ